MYYTGMIPSVSEPMRGACSKAKVITEDMLPRWLPLSENIEPQEVASNKDSVGEMPDAGRSGFLAPTLALTPKRPLS
jgi:hypothetical protein